MVKKIGFILLTLVLSHFIAYPLGHWLDSRNQLYGWTYLGPFPGYLDGFLLGLLFISPIIFGLGLNKIKAGLYAGLPVLIIAFLLGADNPPFWMDLVFFVAGLALAHVIFLIKNK